MSRGARDPRQPVTVKWDPTTLLLSFIGSDDDLPIAGFASDSAPSIPKSLVDAKGDLIVASADNTPARLAVGSDGDSLVADSTQTSGLAYSQTAQPNLVLNSDFGRRTVFGLAMPEVFADTSGYVVVSGAAPTVAANIVTSTAANEIAWQAGTFVWRDGRASGSFKAVATAGIYQIKFRVDANIWLSAKQNNGNFTITSGAGAADTVRATVANALTLNRWYWIEIEVQGTTIVGKIYDTGGTVPGVTKASSTLLQTVSFTGVTALTGAAVSVNSDQALAQWGGIATGNGGVYVETWLPESWAGVTFGGTLGGQALGYDESADAGPLAKQWAMRAYIPAATRTITIAQPAAGTLNTAYGLITPSVAYTSSFYYKVSGKGGSGALLTYYAVETSAAGADVVMTNKDNDASSTSWARITRVITTGATTRGARLSFNINDASTATGTVYFMLPQLERGGVATAWRNAPEDGGAPIIWALATAFVANLTTTSAALVELDSRDFAADIFLPYDATVTVDFNVVWSNSGLNTNVLHFTVDGANFNAATSEVNSAQFTETTAAVSFSQTAKNFVRLSAGKHRIAVVWRVTAGTGTVSVNGIATRLFVTATRGK